MHAIRAHQATLSISGLIAVAIGIALLLAPAAMHGANGVELSPNASLLSEIRAPGGALLALGGLILSGAFIPRLRFSATLIAAAVYLSYGFARLLSIAVDGMPATGLIGATLTELVLGALCAAWVMRLWKA